MTAGREPAAVAALLGALALERFASALWLDSVGGISPPLFGATACILAALTVIVVSSR